MSLSKLPVLDAAELELDAQAVRDFARTVLLATDGSTQVSINKPEAYSNIYSQYGRVVRRAAEDGLRFAAGMLANDPSEEAFELLVAAVNWRDDIIDYSDIDSLDQSIGLLTQAMAADDPEVTRAVQSREAGVRGAMANALEASTPAGRKHLLALAADSHTDVRNAARKSLADEDVELPWWLGLFPDDPLAGLDPADAQQAAPALADIAKMLEGAPGVGWVERRERILGAVKKLADPIVVALLPRLLPAERDIQLVQAMVLEALQRKGGPKAVYEIVTAKGADESHYHLVMYGLENRVASFSAERRAEVRHVFGNLPPEGEELSVLGLIFQIGMACAEPDEDRWPLLQALLRRDGYLPAWIFPQAPVPGTPFAENVVDAFRKGFPEPWSSHYCSPFLGWLQKGPADWVRQLAEEGLSSEADAIRRWALSMLTGPAWDEARDGSREARAAALAMDPRYAKDFEEDTGLAARVLEMRREQVRRGEATIAQAESVFAVLDQTERAAKLGLEPPTAEEWAELRRLRAAAYAADPAAARANRCYLRYRQRDNAEDDALFARWVRELVTPEEAEEVFDLLVMSGSSPVEEEHARQVYERFRETKAIARTWRLYNNIRKAKRARGKDW